MSLESSSQSAADAAERFLASLRPADLGRIEVKVAGGDGMPVLCAVEAVLARTLVGPAPQELVWLGAAAGGPLLSLRAFGPDGRLLAEAAHAFEG